jgi:hypothetical protein
MPEQWVPCWTWDFWDREPDRSAREIEKRHLIVQMEGRSVFPRHERI